jgi:hypothetical protein
MGWTSDAWNWVKDKAGEVGNAIGDSAKTFSGGLIDFFTNANAVLERFKTIEQPKIEDILDSVDGNLEESKEVLEQVKKLFVTKKKIPLDITEIDQLPDFTKSKLGFLVDEANNLESTVTKDLKLLSQYREIKAGFQPTDLEIQGEIDSIKLGIFAKSSLDDITKKSLDNVEKETEAYMRPSVFSLTKELTPTIDKYFAQNSRYESFKAYQMFHWGEINKLHGEIDKIKYVYVDEPGVIPRTLAKIEDIVTRVNTEEQPRIEKIMDSVNGNLVESQGILNKINGIAGKVIGFVGSHTLLLKIGIGIAGAGIVLTLVLIPILLIRWIVWGV